MSLKVKGTERVSPYLHAQSAGNKLHEYLVVLLYTAAILNYKLTVAVYVHTCTERKTAAHFFM
jgi:hypothetical protein